MKSLRAILTGVFVVLGTIYAEKKMPDEKWLLLFVACVGIVLALVHWRCWRSDLVREMRQDAIYSVRTARHSVDRGSFQVGRCEEAIAVYEGLLKKVPREMRQAAPRLTRSGEKLQGDYRVLEFLETDKGWWGL